jgi:hypothetical protein
VYSTKENRKQHSQNFSFHGVPTNGIVKNSWELYTAPSLLHFGCKYMYRGILYISRNFVNIIVWSLRVNVSHEEVENAYKILVGKLELDKITE